MSVTNRTDGGCIYFGLRTIGALVLSLPCRTLAKLPSGLLKILPRVILTRRQRFGMQLLMIRGDPQVKI